MSEDWVPADYYEAVQIGWPMSDHSINLTDVTRQPHPDPCPDCGREHMNGEHISLTVPASDGGTRTVWEGCADCWAKRTGPYRREPMTGMTPERLDAMRKRAEAATEGPWKASDFGHYGRGEPESIVVHTGEFDHSDLRTSDTETAVAWMPRWEGQESDNATFIAHARTDVPDLLNEVRRLRDGIKEMARIYDLHTEPFSDDLRTLLDSTEGDK